MNKKVQKGLVAAVAATMGASIAAPAIQAATVDLATQYAQAYAAYEKAAKSKDQKDLTEARALLDALYARVKGTKEEYLATTLTSLLDPVQQSKFEFIIAVTKTKVEEVEQKNINEGKYNFNNLSKTWQKWFESYSSALDTVQQGYYEHVLNLVKNAKTQAELDAAKVKFTDLMTMNHSDEVKKVYESTIKTEVEKVEAELAKLKVESVKAIDALDNETIITDGAKIDPTGIVEVKFSKPVDKETVISDAFKVINTNGNIRVGGTVSFDENSNTAKFVVFNNGTLDRNSTFKIALSGIKTVDGKETLEKTIDINTTDKFVIASYTMDNANRAFSVTFNSQVDAATVNTSTVKLYNITDGKYIADADNSIGLSNGNKTITFIPSTSLPNNKDAKVILAGVKALDGSALDNKEIKFNTSGNWGVGANFYIGTTTYTLSNDYSVNNNVYPKLTSDSISNQGFVWKAVFDTSMDASTINNTTVVLKDATNNKIVEANVVYEPASKTLTVVPKSDLTDETKYTVTLSKDIKTSAGNKVSGGNDIVSKFATGDYTKVTVEDSQQQGQELKLDDHIKFTFNEEIDPATLVFSNGSNAVGSFSTASGQGRATVELVNVTDNTLVDVSSWSNLVAVDANKKTVVDLTIPSSVSGNFQKGKTYKLVIKGYTSADTVKGIDDAADAYSDNNLNYMENAYELNFSIAGYDNTAPVVKSVLQGASSIVDAYNVYKTSNIKVAFDDKINLFNNLGAGVTGNYLTDLTANTAVKFLDATGSFANVAGTLSFTTSAAASNGSRTIQLASVTGLKIGDKVEITNTDTTVEVKKVTDIVGTTISLDSAIAGNGIANTTAGVKLVRAYVDADGKTLVVRPTIVNDDKYQLAITAAQVKNIDGTVMESDSKTTFTAGAGPAIDIANTTPTKYATAVSVSGNITIQLDDAQGVDRNTVNSTTVKLINVATGAQVDAEYTVPASGDNFNLIINPKVDLAQNTQYKVEVSGVKDLKGNVCDDQFFTFTTESTATPTWTIVGADDGQDGIATNQAFKVVFSADMDESTLTSANISLTAADDTYLVQGTGLVDADTSDDLVDATYSYDAASKTLTITPKSALKTGTEYTLSVSNNVRGANTKRVPANSIAFRTSTIATSPVLKSAKWLSIQATPGTEDGLAGDKIVLTFDAPVTGNSAAAAIADYAVNNGTLAAADIASVTAVNNMVVITMKNSVGSSFLLDGVSSIKATSAKGLDGTIATGTVTITTK